MKKIYKQGFTLIELSIVLVIIGVLVGGIMIGKTLVDSSKLQTVITDVDSYTAAVGNFKQAYQALPGDFSNAQGIWGSLSTLCHTSSDKTNGTCNGNGDGQITGNGSGGVATASNSAEMFMFWQHLNRAGMFNQSLSGQAGSGSGSDATIGTNVPAGSVKGSGFSVIWYGVLSSDANAFNGSYGNVIIFGAKTTSSLTNSPILTADKAAYVDAKIDDGFPGTGKVRAYYYNSTLAPKCTTSASTVAATTTAYNLTATGNVCSLIFVMGF